MVRRALQGLRIEVDDGLRLRLEPFVPFGVTDADSFRALVQPLLEQAGTFSGMRGLERALGPSFPLPENEPKAQLFYTPIPRWGMKFALPEGSRHGVGFAPFMTDGVEHLCEIEGLTLGPDRLQAVVHGDVGGLPVSFYDPAFVDTRHQMVQGSANHIVFAGLCLTFAQAVDHSFEITDPKTIRAMHDISGHVDESGPIQVRTEGMAAIIPADSIGPDFHSVHGPVVSIRRGELDWLGQGFWRVRVVVARDIYDEPLPSFRSNGDFEIDLILTDMILGNEPIPAVGEDVEALIWLQGRLSGAGPVELAKEQRS